MFTPEPSEMAIDVGSEDARLRATTGRMIAVGIVLAVAGFGTACALGLGTFTSFRLFFHAYLTVFALFLSITLGALFFVLLHHLCRAGWSVTLRRLAEALSGNVGLMLLLFLPLVAGMGDLYPWWRMAGGASLFHTNGGRAVGFCPGGASDNSPAGHHAKHGRRWDTSRSGHPASPVGTIERGTTPRLQSSLRDSENPRVAHLPSDKSLGYYQSSLRDGETQIVLCAMPTAMAADEAQIGGTPKGDSPILAAPKSGQSPGQAVYLTPTAFLLRMAVYFAVWGALTWYLRSQSLRQDATGDVRLTAAMERVSGPGMILLAVTVTLASVDLLMSLSPHWSSTIFGVYYFIDCILSGLVVLTLLALGLQAAGHLRGAITVEHYHDLGKLTFAFVFFWGYIAFSQYLLIWYANMPEETQYYQPRQAGPWAAVSIVLVLCHLLIPFAGLLSRHAKRRLGVFAFWAIWVLAAQLLDMFWLVMPNLFAEEIAGGADAALVPAVSATLGPLPLAIVAGLSLGMGGLLLANTARLLRAGPMVPVADPRLSESLAFENA